MKASILILILLISFSTTNSQPRVVRAALAQIFCLDGDRSGNFRRFENALLEAKKKELK